MVFLVPCFATNMISVSKFCIDGNSFFEFHPYFFLIDQIMRKALLQGKLKNDLYKFPTQFVQTTAPLVFFTSYPNVLTSGNLNCQNIV